MVLTGTMIASLIAAALGSTGAQIGSAFGQQASDQAFQAEQAQLQRDWQTAENSAMREWQSSENQLSRDWETEMSNTAYQRSVADMESAGLNPMAAFGLSNPSAAVSGASVGSAASAPSSSSGVGSSIHSGSSGSFMKQLTSLIGSASMLQKVLGS